MIALLLVGRLRALQVQALAGRCLFHDDPDDALKLLDVVSCRVQADCRALQKRAQLCRQLSLRLEQVDEADGNRQVVVQQVCNLASSKVHAF